MGGERRKKKYSRFCEIEIHIIRVLRLLGVLKLVSERERKKKGGWGGWERGRGDDVSITQRIPSKRWYVIAASPPYARIRLLRLCGLMTMGMISP